MNVDFYLDANSRFTTRSMAIIFNDDRSKILLFKIEDGRDFYMLPGGRIEFFETSSNAIKREIQEETGYDIDFTLSCVQENFLVNGNTKIMQYAFCYMGIYQGEIQDKFSCLDSDGQSFYWVNLSDIDNYKIMPESSVSIIKKESDVITHTVETIQI